MANRSFRHSLHEAKMAVRHRLMDAGIDFYKRSDDRRVLEKIVLPYFARTEGYRRVLFVGCEWYTRGYRHIFKHAEYVTLDFDPAKARYGAGRHITDSATNIRQHFGENSLDLIICNGVFGWGLNARPDVEEAFGGCYEALRDGGVFVLGWDDIPRLRPFPPTESTALTRFRPFILPPLRTSHVLTRTAKRHTYDFFVR